MVRLCPLSAWLVFVLALVLQACATTRTMPSVATPKQPKVYSGTRLDINAIAKNEEHLRRFDAEPPKYPLIDLPFSLLLDTLILPKTVPAATYEFFFNE